MTLVSGEELTQWRQEAREQAVQHAVPPGEVDWLLQEIGQLSPWQLRTSRFEENISLALPLSGLREIWNKRVIEKVPLQYLLGVAYWRYFKLTVTQGVLIPRPETEEVIDILKRFLAVHPHLDTPESHWVDLGTGSGVIAFGLTEVLKHAHIYAVDVSQEALNIARQNAKILGLTERIHFLEGSWWSPLSQIKGRISGMVSNPPYIPKAMIPQLPPEVALHEPSLALDGGEDGLEHLRYLVQSAPDYLSSGGIWLTEIMKGQGKSVTKMLQKQGLYRDIQVHLDYSAVDRFILAHRI